MNKKFVLMVFTSVFLLLGMVVAQFIMPAAADSVVIRVPEDCSTVQEAINAASPGDIIQVAAGTYYEHVTINKPLTLIGEDGSNTVIDGNGTDTVIRITASNVGINGFTVQNSGNSFFWDSGIFVELSSSSNNISGNIITSNGGNGISLNHSSNNIISNNQVSNNGDGFPGLVWGGGIYLLYGSNNTVSDNTITNNVAWGVVIDSSSNNTIGNNVITNSSESISLSNSGDNIISGNIITSLNGGAGVRLDGSRGNVISNNTILGRHGEGIRSGGSSHGNIIVGNTISGSTRGIMWVVSNNNTFVANTISGSDEGIMLDNTRGNIIYHNNFVNNIKQVYDPSWDYPWVPPSINTWNNSAGEGNYWSDYEGLDLDGDGIGDTLLPHSKVDYHPLIIPWGPIPIIWNGAAYPVALLSNSTISAFKFEQPLKQISFNVTGPPGTSGFCNVTITKTLLRANETHPWQVLLDGNPISYTKVENATHTSLYFTYTHTTHHIQIIGTWVTPEFPTALILPLLIITALAVTILRKMTQPTKKPTAPRQQ